MVENNVQTLETFPQVKVAPFNPIYCQLNSVQTILKVYFIPGHGFLIEFYI